MTVDPIMEQQYNNRAAVPEHPELLADWAARSAAWEADAKTVLELAYGDSNAETLDLFTADAEGAPVHMYIHGGYWQAGTKKSSSFVARPLVAAGAHVAVLDYALCPDVTLDEIVRQTRAALAWLYRNVGTHGGDAERITMSGHSCGGHLVGMAMATDWPSFGAGLPRDLVKGGVSVSGLFDLAPLIRTTINNKVGMDEENARRNSPVLHEPACAAPLALLVGGLESDEYHRQSRDFAAAWRAHGVPVEVSVVPERNHFTILAGMDTPDDPVIVAILKQSGLG